MIFNLLIIVISTLSIACDVMIIYYSRRARRASERAHKIIMQMRRERGWDE